MRIALSAFVAVLALSASSAVLAADTPPPTVQPVSVQQGQPLICHYYYHQGMVIGRPDCRTADQWKHRQIDDQRFLREFQLRTLAAGD